MKFCADAAEVIRAMAENAESAGSAESDGSMVYDFSEWLAVCADIKKSLRAVDDSTPERYPNRMIAALSDALADTSAVAVDVGQHMVCLLYTSFGSGAAGGADGTAEAGNI